MLDRGPLVAMDSGANSFMFTADFAVSGSIVPSKHCLISATSGPAHIPLQRGTVVFGLYDSNSVLHVFRHSAFLHSDLPLVLFPVSMLADSGIILIFTAQLGSLGDLFSFLSLDRMGCIWLQLSMFLLIRLIYGILDKYLLVILCQLHFLSSLVPSRIRLLCLLTLLLSLYYLWLGLLFHLMPVLLHLFCLLLFLSLSLLFPLVLAVNQSISI